MPLEAVTRPANRKRGLTGAGWGAGGESGENVGRTRMGALMPCSRWRRAVYSLGERRRSTWARASSRRPV